VLNKLKKIKIKGFKSIESNELELSELNVVIGANGSGKSNLLSAFRLLERVLSQRLQNHVASDPDRLLFHGRRTTHELSLNLQYELNDYGFILEASQDTLIFKDERYGYHGRRDHVESLGSGHKESKLEDAVNSRKNKIAKRVYERMRKSVVYHFQDASDNAPAKQTANLNDNWFLRPDAANLPAYLYWLKIKHSLAFQRIEEHIRLVAPFFDKFVLIPSKLDENKIKLEWRQKGSDAYFDAYSLSDGTLRFICLATLLLQPSRSLPNLILLDEPELGLHPFAISILAEMLETAAEQTQVIVVTQSITLLNHFSPEHVIVAQNDAVRTRFERLDTQNLQNWLTDYSLGELWEKNVLGGRP